jgi:amino acid transporter
LTGRAGDAAKREDRMGFWSVVAIGIGGMVGGGIFAVLGLAVQLSGGGTPVAFAMAGAVALLTAYSYARLSAAYPSQGGTVEFLNRAFGPGLITGGLNVLLWQSYVIMLSLYAYAFGSYGASYFPPEHHDLARHLLASAAVIVLTAMNAAGADIVGRSERLIVALKIAILVFFLAVSLWTVDPRQLAPDTWTDPLRLVAGGMLIFVAYEGFELIANTAADVSRPRIILPRAYFVSVLFVAALYVLISMAVVGNLSLDQIVSARDYALAEAARPVLGHAGFALIVAAALLSTGSAINATLYGAARLSYVIAKEGELPRVFERRLWRQPIEGLLLTAALTLVVANAVDLSGIAMMGSAGFLVIFAVVNVANLRLRRETQARPALAAAAAAACVAALAMLLWQAAEDTPGRLWFPVLMVISAFFIEAAYRRWSGRPLLPLADLEERGDGGLP